jgi:D-glycero-alpha-D-manno-heptose 1-phosphate guanylyltransferase
MFTEAIILAGGLGTRLQQAVPELPKCLAPVNGMPFIQYVVNHLASQKIERIILSLGYRSEQVKEYFEKTPQGLEMVYVTEPEPLGTGGAIKLAIQQARSSQVLVTNGDSLNTVNLEQLANAHHLFHATATISLKPMKKFSRYGSVLLHENGHVTSFREKLYCEEGLINTGVYAIDRLRFNEWAFPEKFSFEKDFLEKYCVEGIVSGFVQDAYFIDIGIPEDYERANREL